jgi:hypothetical protein
MLYYGNIFVIVLLSYYTIYYINIFINGYKQLQQTNIKLNSMRKISVKTLDEQKAFLDLKYPKSQKTKRTFLDWYFIIIMFIISISMYLLYNYLFNVFKIRLTLLYGLLIVSILPVLINIILLKFNMDNNDLVNLFKK